ncbi:MAG: tetraacyldisaccharide 4'-kinase [Deltaproteobacteria bacterium]|nr:tetraacyldisaccharide 4'-kinase [Deltaproteobacteria bacterium]
MNESALERLREGLDTRPPRLWLRPAAALVRFAVGLKNLAYDAGVLHPTKVACPVVCVGNLTIGGNGKTPFVVWLARSLEREGLRVAVVSRGFGGSAGSAPVVVSLGQGPLVSADVAGDEPFLIARKTKAAVVVGSDRARAAKVAIDRARPDLVLLDDGFSHRRLHRDLDIILLDHARPFGNGSLLPAGPLREPRAALARAGLTVRVISSDEASDLIVDADAEVTPVASALTDLAGNPYPLEVLRGQTIDLLAAISRPARFAHTAEALGGAIARTRFLDDHALVGDAHARFELEAAETGAMVLVTEKDAAKLPAKEGPTRVLEIALRFSFGEERVLDRVRAIVGPRET